MLPWIVEMLITYIKLSNFTKNFQFFVLTVLLNNKISWIFNMQYHQKQQMTGCLRSSSNQLQWTCLFCNGLIDLLVWIIPALNSFLLFISFIGHIHVINKHSLDEALFSFHSKSLGHFNHNNFYVSFLSLFSLRSWKVITNLSEKVKSLLT